MTAPRGKNPLVARAMAGELDYDSLGDVDQAAVRAAWQPAIEDAIAGLNFEAILTAAGESWAESDAQGNLVVRCAPTASVPTKASDRGAT